MSSLGAERYGWQRAIRGTSANEAQLSRVFPDYIYVNPEEFMKADDPFWEPDRPTISSLYRARVSAQGRIFCTRRMQRWLHSLPDRPDTHSESIPPKSSPRTPSVPLPSASTRSRAQSAPAPRPPRPATSALGTDHSLSSFRFGHPNPLSQHPVQLEERESQPQSVDSQLDKSPQLDGAHYRLEAYPQLEASAQLDEVLPKLEEAHPKLREVTPRFEEWCFQPKIPQRRSSLYFNSQPASHAQQSHHPLSQFGDLFQGLEQTQVSENETSESEKSQEDGEACDNRSVASQPKHEDNMRVLPRSAHKRHTIHFGSNLDEIQQQASVGDPEKNGRAQSAAIVVDEREKRTKSLFGSVRNRRSSMGTPAGPLNNGRKSSASVMLKDMGRSSKEFLSKLTLRKKEEYNLRAAFIGNQHCGKNVLLSRYTLAASTGGNNVHRPDVDSFGVKLAGVFAIDNYKARTEIWDIAHWNVKNGQAHPLSMKPFDVVVICVDVGDQRNLKSVAKWQRVAQRYCPSVPTIVLGLKADLRPHFPTLRLGFLQESTAFTVGQGEETARMNKASAYYECSAKNGEGVTEFFESLIRFTVQATRTRYKLRQKASRRFSNLFRKE